MLKLTEERIKIVYVSFCYAESNPMLTAILRGVCIKYYQSSPIFGIKVSSSTAKTPKKSSISNV